MQKDKLEEAWRTYFAEEVMANFGFITVEMLTKLRYLLFIAYDFKAVDLSYNPYTQSLLIDVKFPLFRNFLKSKKRILSQIRMALEQRYPDMSISVKEMNKNE